MFNSNKSTTIKALAEIDAKKYYHIAGDSMVSQDFSAADEIPDFKESNPDAKLLTVNDDYSSNKWAKKATSSIIATQKSATSTNARCTSYNESVNCQLRVHNASSVSKRNFKDVFHRRCSSFNTFKNFVTSRASNFKRNSIDRSSISSTNSLPSSFICMTDEHSNNTCSQSQLKSIFKKNEGTKTVKRTSSKRISFGGVTSHYLPQNLSIIEAKSIEYKHATNSKEQNQESIKNILDSVANNKVKEKHEINDGNTSNRNLARSTESSITDKVSASDTNSSRELHNDPIIYQSLSISKTDNLFNIDGKQLNESHMGTSCFAASNLPEQNLKPSNLAQECSSQSAIDMNKMKPSAAFSESTSQVPSFSSIPSSTLQPSTIPTNETLTSPVSSQNLLTNLELQMESMLKSLDEVELEF